jgi:hypothetical protein
MAAPPARARADYDYLIKLLLIGDSGEFPEPLAIPSLPVRARSARDLITSGTWFVFRISIGDLARDQSVSIWLG